MIERVEQLDAEVDVLTFRHVELLPDRRVEVEEARRTEDADAGGSESADCAEYQRRTIPSSRRLRRS